ncbi:hypothetical protein CAPTEDRAFT_109253, partial [Capitella teleta]
IGVLKTFDSVQYKILLSKLLRYKIRGNPHRWFANFISGRQQSVIFNDCTSNGY